MHVITFFEAMCIVPTCTISIILVDNKDIVYKYALHKVFTKDALPDPESACVEPGCALPYTIFFVIVLVSVLESKTSRLLKRLQ